MKQIPHNWSDLQQLVDGVPTPVPAEDVQVAQGYAGFSGKGELVDGQRCTILTAQTRYAVGEAVRVVHVHEVVAEGVEMEAMGPKPIYDEYLDGVRMMPPAPAGGGYDGPRILSPAIDYFYDVTVYRFDAPGRHGIEWRPGGLQSNTLRLSIH